MEDHKNSSSSRLLRKKKKKSTLPKSLNLAEDADADSTPVKHKSCSQLSSSKKGDNELRKPVKHRSCVNAPKNQGLSGKHNMKKPALSPRCDSPRPSGGFQSFSSSPHSSFGGFGSPRGSRPPIMLGADAKPVQHPILASVISYESSKGSYDTESEVHFIRRFSRGYSNRTDRSLQKPTADTVPNEADDQVQFEIRHPQRKEPDEN
ncbi:hypothetical protein FGB62_94g059 [Gracilaria domingensis]|nr:hypothetical protein FGB62_94g059 [Gracilaria domingensis]